VHGVRTTQGLPGQRVAVNLRDVAPDDVARGDALTARGLLPPSAWLTVALRSTTGAPALATSAKLMLLFGTQEVEARLRLLDCDELPPGGTALAQLRCAAPVSVPAREKFILRRISPPLTVAGGRVIDPAAVRLRRRAPGVLTRLAAVSEAEPAGIVAAETAAAGAQGIALSRLAQLAGVSEARAAALLPPAVLGRSRTAVSAAEWERVLAAIPGVVAAAEAEVPPDRLAALLPWAGRAVVDDAAADRARADEDALAAARMAETLRAAGLSPPDVWVVVPDVRAKRLADRLVREGVVVRAVDKVQKRELLFHQDAVEAARQRLRPLLAGRGLLVSEAGAALGISRKYCVPLLEHLDAIRFTRRIADRRVLAD
jgi:selenocysteine-specific elongation factor